VLRILFCLTWNLSMGHLDLEETGLSCESAGGNTERGGSVWACKQGIRSANTKKFSRSLCLQFVSFANRGGKKNP